MKQVWNIFRIMPRREKIVVGILTFIFLLSVSNFIGSRLRFPIPQEKGVFQEGMVGRIGILNPLFVDFNETDRDMVRLIFSGLIQYDPIQKNFLPDLAEKWERSKNGLEYTFTLRPNILWHDGKSLTAEDIFFTFHDVIQDPGFRSPLLKNAFEGIEVAQISPLSITFRLPKVNSYFISNLTVGILPKHLLLKTPIANLEKSYFREHPIGSGPYQVVSIKHQKERDIVDLVAFPRYYGKKPVLNKLRFLTFSDEISLEEEQKALHGISKLWMGSPALKSISADPRFAIFPYTLNQFTAIVFNTDDPFLKDKRLRRSLNLSLNKNELVMLGEERVDTISLKNQSENPLFSFDFAAAGKALDTLGFKLSKEGFRKNGRGETISFTLLSHEKIPQEIAEKIRNQWQNLGIRIMLERAGGNEWKKRLMERDYGALLIRQNLGYNRDLYPLLHSSQISGVGLNFSNFKSFRTDGLTEAIRKEKNPPDKEKLLNELSKVISEEIPLVFLSTPVYAYALDKRLQSLPAGSFDFHSDRLSILPHLSFL